MTNYQAEEASSDWKKSTGDTINTRRPESKDSHMLSLWSGRRVATHV